VPSISKLKPLERVPIIILNGFLGSGKTTLFRNLLAQSKKLKIDVRAIVNDMSDLDVDGELISNTVAVEENKSILVSIHSCVLSSDKGIQKLEEALQTLQSNHHPELIVIETSGSCHPMPLIQFFKKHTQVQLTGVFTLVDSLMLSQDFDNGASLIPQMQSNLTAGKRNTVNLLVEQILFSSHIFLTKTDRIASDILAPLQSVITNINPHAAQHVVLYGKVDLNSLFHLQAYDYFRVAQLVEELKPVLATETQNDRPYGLATRVIHDERPFHPQRLWDVCHAYLDPKIYRSKGFFWLASRGKYALLWNQAAGRISLEINGTWRIGIAEDENHGISEMEISQLKDMLAKEYGRFGDRKCDLTVIGDQSQVDGFTQALESCFLSEEEIELWQEGHAFEDPWPQNMVRLTPS
jgi:G3E family GTPase